MIFRPLVDQTTLPQQGTAIERAMMDWKVKPAPHAFEKAKDIAAFANHLGGTLLIGAEEDNPTGQLKCYVGLTLTEANDVRDSYSKSVAQRCRPLPTYDFVLLEAPNDATKRVVAINVWSSLNLIGVKVQANKATEGWGGDVFAYPVRSGTDAIFLQPTELAMYMTPEVRRNAVLLARITAGSPIKVTVLGEGHSFAVNFDSVEEESNLVKLTPKTGPGTIHLPLDRISTVYQNEAGEWQLAIQPYRR